MMWWEILAIIGTAIFVFTVFFFQIRSSLKAKKCGGCASCKGCSGHCSCYSALREYVKENK